MTDSTTMHVIRQQGEHETCQINQVNQCDRLATGATHTTMQENITHEHEGTQQGNIQKTTRAANRD